jgi:hypothetical protein
MTDAKEWAEQPSDNAPEPDDVRLLKRRIGQLERQLSGYKAQTSLVVDALSEIFAEPPALKLPPRVRRGSAKKREEVAVLHVSDTQIGKVTATYDTATAADRLMKLAETTLRATEDRRQSAKIDRCCVFLGGDLVEGETIFGHQIWEIESNVLQQAVRDTPEMISRMIMRLAEGFHTVEVYGVPGNHGRSAPRNSGASPKTNWDVVAMEVTRLMLQNAAAKGRIEWRTTDSWYQIVDVLGWSNMLIHGDRGVRGFNGFPWYGVGRASGRWSQILRDWESADGRWRRYLWMGHFHTYAGPVVFNNVVMLANGTTESDNEYAAADLSAAGEPCQRLAFFDEEHGLVADHQVFLEVK